MYNVKEGKFDTVPKYLVEAPDMCGSNLFLPLNLEWKGKKEIHAYEKAGSVLYIVKIFPSWRKGCN